MFELSGVSRNRGFEKSGVKLQSLNEANPRETRLGSRYREVRDIGIPLYIYFQGVRARSRGCMLPQLRAPAGYLAMTKKTWRKTTTSKIRRII